MLKEKLFQYNQQQDEACRKKRVLSNRQKMIVGKNKGAHMGKHIEQTDLTRQSIVDAFWIIAKTEGNAMITVSAVAKKAGVNRSTFYEYFSDMDGLIDSVETALTDELKELIGALYMKYNLNCSHRDLAKALIPYYERLTILLKRDTARRFLFRIQKEAVDLFSKVTVNPDPMIEYEIAYMVSAFTGLLLYREETGRKIDEDTFTELFHTLSIRGLSAQCTNADILL